MTSTMYFGGTGGNSQAVPDNGAGKEVVFWTGTRIDAIQIDGKKYGGPGGGRVASAILPDDGVFYIKKIQTRELNGKSAVLQWLEADINGQPISVGVYDGKLPMLDAYLPVKFIDIHSGAYVDGINFEIIFDSKYERGNQLLFGSVEALYAELDTNTQKTMIVRSGLEIDSIQVGNAVYGGSGGRANPPVEIPANGTIYLNSLQAHQRPDHDPGTAPLTFFDANFGLEHLQAGTPVPDAKVLKATVLNLSSGNGGMPVNLAGIYYKIGDRVTALKFHLDWR
ncbi:hypothetical protein [Archangium lipolyticum]|uniref:hypothetical protein n=1 Tax=Archangium lipolyticum TaxID=2970465 RepID=UPI00214A399E|nr:hypothetical protein [Archangium lipolyticum]